MPELPEVETIVRGLRGCVGGKKISSIQVLHKKPLGRLTKKQFTDFLGSQIITTIRRIGKYLLFDFDSGKKMLVHLRMTGKFIFRRQRENHEYPSKHIRLIFLLHDGSRLLFQDMRLFATFSLYGPNEELREIRKLGPDPFSGLLTADRLQSMLSSRKTALKAVLLNQQVISGLGNIYACEALHRANLHPAFPADNIDRFAARNLLAAIRKVLNLAIKLGGTTIRDFNGVDNKSGNFQNMLRVYGRNGLECKTCRRAVIRKITQAGRSSFFCPVCQPLPSDVIL